VLPGPARILLPALLVPPGPTRAGGAFVEAGVVGDRIAGHGGHALGGEDSRAGLATRPALWDLDDMEAYLKSFGLLAALGGAVLMLRALLLHTAFEGEEGRFRPSGKMTPEGKKHFFRGVVLLVLAHVLRDVIPGILQARGGA